MYTCPNPSCKKALPALAPTCAYCQADLTLLVDYADHLRDALERADRLAGAGHLGEAVWAYLEVLEVDPDNPLARRQVGQVAAAVRQFDQTVQARSGRARALTGGWPGWARFVLVLVLLAGAFLLGYHWPVTE
jgi:hypothetical protein